MRVWAVILNPDNKEEEKFEILDTNFVPETNAVIILKRGDEVTRASVVKTESVLDREGENADYIFNVFIKILPPEENVN
jgi:predicted RND superfamily exporter protein